MSDQVRPILLLSSRTWNSGLSDRLNAELNRNVNKIRKPAELTLDVLENLNPEWIFVPHWSHLIPDQIWSRWPTVIFHMTDLPYGKGGSPLQNLIQRGHTSTMITALRCSSELDGGPVYLKESLSLHGTAEEIYIRADAIIQQMIQQIVLQLPDPQPQEGNSVMFKRRHPEQSNLAECSVGSCDEWYEQIRMLDAEGYPHAFLEAHGMRLELRRVSQRSDGLHADVKIMPIAASQPAPKKPPYDD